MEPEKQFDYDYVIIGSGFGGSVSALRLGEKGYKVAVLEKGRRYHNEDFPRSNWDVRKSLWMPGIRLYGIFALTFLKHVFVLHGAGVGGGSLNYCNQLLVPPDEVFEKPEWGHGDWKARLAPFYGIAKDMLGGNPSPRVGAADEILAEIGNYLGGRDHATVVHAEKRARVEIARDETYRRAVENVFRCLGRPAPQIE